MVSSLPLSAKLRVCSVMLLALRSAWVWELKSFSNPALDGFINAVSQIGGHHLAVFSGPSSYGPVRWEKVPRIAGKNIQCFFNAQQVTITMGFALDGLRTKPSVHSKKAFTTSFFACGNFNEKKRFPVCLVCQDSTPEFQTTWPKRFKTEILLRILDLNRFKHQGTSALTLWKFCMFLRLPKTCSASSMKTATPTASGPDEILDRIWLLALRTPQEQWEIRPKRCKYKQD